MTAEVVAPLSETLGPLLTALLGCTVAALNPTPKVSFVATGIAPAWDECCEGMAWVRVQSLEMVRPPAMGMTLGDPCRRSWLTTVGVGALRCASTVQDIGGNWAPKPSAITADSMQVLLDEAAILNAMHCCVPPSTALKSLTVVRWDALGPEGGCVGGEWTVNLTVQSYECAEPP